MPRKPPATKPAAAKADGGGTIDLTIGPPPVPEVEPSTPGLDYVDDIDVVEAPQVDESVVRTMLRSVAGVTSHVVGRDDVPDHWRFTPQELDDLTPPLTRVINRRPALRAAVARGDEAAIGIVLASYTGRNFAAGRKAALAEEKLQRDKQQAEARSAAGAVPTGGAGPDQSFDSNGYGRHGSVVHRTDGQ